MEDCWKAMAMSVASLPLSKAERDAIGLYAVADRDIMDFLDMLAETTNPLTLQTLYEMVTYENPNQSERNARLNALLVDFVKSRCDVLGIETG